VATLLTWVGLFVTLVGVGCGVIAYRRTWTEHGSGPLWPVVHRGGTLLRHWMMRLLPFRRRRGVTVQAGAALSAEAAMSVRAIKSGLLVPDDAPLDQQIRLLVRRIEHVEYEAAEDRKQHKTDIKAVRADMSNLAMRLRQADRDLEALAKSVAASTVRLQVVGLILVGSGTSLMALPTILGL
jgi:hypothetical protein